MDPKSGKRLRLFVNPFAIWTNFAFKSGEAMLDAAQAAVARPAVERPVPKVAVIPTADAPTPKTAHTKISKAARKARKNASSRARRRGR
jgi:hypothetical protein